MNAFAPSSITVRHHGFTLLEVLIAVTITAVIGLGVWQVLSSVIASRDRVDEVAGEFDGVVKTFLLLERDLGQVVNRPARNVYGDYEFAFTSQGEEFALQLTRQGWRNPLGIRRSELQRVAWEYTGSELRRRYWETVDQGQEDNSHDQLLLSGVKSFEIRFMTSEHAWTDQWPGTDALANLTPGARPDIPLPIAVEVTLEHERFGELSRTLALPDYDPALAIGALTEAQGQQGEGEEEVDEEADSGEQQTPQESTGTGGGSQ